MKISYIFKYCIQCIRTYVHFLYLYNISMECILLFHLKAQLKRQNKKETLL